MIGIEWYEILRRVSGRGVRRGLVVVGVFLTMLLVVGLPSACVESTKRITIVQADSSVLVTGEPTIDPAGIEEILVARGSPAAGQGDVFYDIGIEYGIDPVVALAWFAAESQMGTDEWWVGHKPDGTTTHNIGNIRCAGYYRCWDGFRDYETWEDGIRDWYSLIHHGYVAYGLDTVGEIVPIYAPRSDNNNPDTVIAVIETTILMWRQGYRK